MNTTTQTFSRTSRISGTERANAIEHYKKADTSGKIIAYVLCAGIMAFSFYLGWRMV